MNNFINYYYNINVNNIRKIDNNYFFQFDNKKYCLYQLDNLDINSILDTINKLKYNKYMHTVILSKDKKIITNDGNNQYILFRINILNNRQIAINDLVFFNRYVFLYDYSKINKKSCISKWCKKIDYLEYYFDSRDDLSNVLKYTFYYLIGLGEVGIRYLDNNCSNNSYSTLVCHKRIKYNYTLYDLYNPINFIMDESTRDISEYLKSIFWNEKYNFFELEKVIESINYNKDEFVFMISRLLYPTYFFDLFENLFLEKINEDYIIKKFDKINDYQIYIKNIIMLIKKVKNISLPIIEWL